MNSSQTFSEPDSQAAISNYELFMKRRQQLLQLAIRLRKLLQSLALQDDQQSILAVQKRIAKDNFKVLILGEFKRGKSTLINALLGDEILPAYAFPTTAIINEVKWGDRPRAFLHFRPAEDGNMRPPQEVGVNDIEKYVVIPEGVDQKEAAATSPYEKVELFWPLELCRSGVEIIDSPGLNEHSTRTKVTLDYLQQVDAVIFVIACDFSVSKSEQAVIENTLHGMGLEDTFFVCNRYDAITNERDRLGVRSRCLKLLAPHTRFKEQHVFFVSARKGLDGRKSDNMTLLHESGIPELEQSLASFLIGERGRVKIAKPAKQLKTMLRKVREEILTAREQMLNTDAATIEKRYQDAQQQLNHLEHERQLIISRVEHFRLETREQVKQAANVFYLSTADQVDGWVEPYQPQHALGVKDIFGVKKATKRLVSEITEYINDQIESEVTVWQEETLTPLLTTRMESLRQNLDAGIQQFISQVDEVRVRIATGSVGVDVEGKDVPAWERVLAAASGLLLIDVGSAALGGAFGFKGLIASIIPQLTVLIVGYMLVGLNPVLLVPVIITALIQGGIRLDSTTKEVKKRVASGYADQLRNQRDELSDKIAEASDAKLLELQRALDQGLGTEIQSIRDQVEAVMVDHRQGQARVEQALQELTIHRKELNAIETELDDLVAQVVL